MPAISVVSLVLICRETSFPFKITLLSSNLMVMPSTICLSKDSLKEDAPVFKAAKATALYIAPVSKNWKFSVLASSFAAVLLPAPAGPSMVIIMI